MYISNMAIRSMPFGREWTSSAKNLENQLRARGIVLQDKLFYEYKMPGGDSQSDFMNKLIMEGFFNDFYSRHLGNILKDKNLNLADKINIFRYVRKIGRSKNKIGTVGK